MAREVEVGAARELVPGVVRGARRYAVGNADGELFAVTRRCRHLGADLANGSIDREGCLVCPWHGARYDVATGRMTRGPQGFVARIPGVDAGYRLMKGFCPLVGACSSSEKAPCSFVSTGHEEGTMMVAFDEVVEKITDAVRHVEADGGASPVLVAVVREFQAKLAKAEKHATGGMPAHDSVIELEQAGDSAKLAAEADAGLSSDARESVLAAHLAICKLKAGA